MAKYQVELETGGTVWKVLAKAGETVSEGQEIFILEVMKMEVPYTAPGRWHTKRDASFRR